MKARRRFLAILGACAFPAPLASLAQEEKSRVRRIGFLNARFKPNELDTAFREAMRALGYVQGRTLEIEYRWGADSEGRAEQLAGELVARNVEAIVTATTPAIRGAMRATSRIPIIMAASADPVGASLVASLARPGGNVTGLTLISTDTAAKRLQLLRELIPSATRVALLYQKTGSQSLAGTQVNTALVAQLQDASRQLGMSLDVQGVASAAEIPGAVAAARHGGAQALIVPASPMTIEHRMQIVEQAARHRLPAMYETEVFAAMGGLLSYGPNLADMYRRAAGYVDRILRGAKPGELPIEQPSKYELVINLKTANALGLRIPPTFLLRADRVIE